MNATELRGKTFNTEIRFGLTNHSCAFHTTCSLIKLRQDSNVCTMPSYYYIADWNEQTPLSSSAFNICYHYHTVYVEFSVNYHVTKSPEPKQ